MFDLRTGQGLRELMNVVHWRAWLDRKVGAFPNFHSAVYNGSRVFGVWTFSGGNARWKDARAADVDAVETDRDDPRGIQRRWSATHVYARERRFLTGHPNLHQVGDGADRVVGTILVPQGAGEVLVVPDEDLDIIKVGNFYQAVDLAQLFRAVNDLAVARGYAGGVPTQHFEAKEAPWGVEIAVFNQGVATWEDVSLRELEFIDHLMTRYRFVDGISSDQRDGLQRGHLRGWRAVSACPSLTETERVNIYEAYNKDIEHRVNSNPSANASAVVGGEWIAVNFGNLFPAGETEIAQTLVHEVAHLAGYTHPVRTDQDEPFDDGPYYSSTPLQAEICIDGVQSDRQCLEVDGTCVITGERQPLSQDAASDITELNSECSEHHA